MEKTSQRKTYQFAKPKKVTSELYDSYLPDDTILCVLKEILFLHNDICV